MLGVDKVGGTSAVGIGPIVETSGDDDVGSVMTTSVGAEVGTDEGTVPGSDIEVGEAAPLHPTRTRMVNVPVRVRLPDPNRRSRDWIFLFSFD